jgi:hypothetical protein
MIDKDVVKAHNKRTSHIPLGKFAADENPRWPPRKTKIFIFSKVLVIGT